MRSHRTGDDAVTYSVDVSYADAADDWFETADDHTVYDRKLDHLEGTVQELGESPRDTFFGHYQEARREAEEDLPRFEATVVPGEEERAGTLVYLMFEDETAKAPDQAFEDAVEDALTETLADTVATWYDATREASPYREEDFTLALEREDGVRGTTFAIGTAPDYEGPVMEQALERMDTDLDRDEDLLEEPRHRLRE